MKRFLKATMLMALPLVCLLLLAACKSPTGPLNYNVAGVSSDIPTITSVVGEREFVGSSVTRYAKAEAGNLSVTCAYSGADDAAADIRRYCESLATNNGFTLQSAFDGTKAVLTAPSTIEGQHIQVTVTTSSGSGYTVTTEILEDDDPSAPVSADNSED